MKKTSLTFAILILLSPIVFAQEGLKEKDIRGEWKLVIDIEEELEKELDDESNAFERMIAKSLSGFVVNLIDEIEVYFEFRANGELKIVVDVFDEREVEYEEWYINQQGKLVIGDNDFSDNDTWIMKNGKLVPEDEDEDNVYLIRVDD